MQFDFLYVWLNVVLLGIFVLAGHNVSNRKSYFINAAWCVVVFSLVQGLRYMRGNDYLRYLHTYLYDDDPHQRLFTLLNTMLRRIGVGPHYFLIIYGGIFMTCALWFIYPYRRFAKYIFPLTLLAFLVFNEYTIRQALAFSFVFLFLYEFIKLRNMEGQYVPTNSIYHHFGLCVAYFTMSYSIHSVSAITIAGLVAISFLPIAIPWWVASIVYIFIVFYASALFDWSVLNSFMEFVAYNGDELTSKYASATDHWFSGNTTVPLKWTDRSLKSLK